MGINECSKPASKSSWDSQDFGDVNIVLKMVHFHKSSRPQWVNRYQSFLCRTRIILQITQMSMAILASRAVFLSGPRH